MVVVDGGVTSVHDLDQALRDLHRLEDSGADGELIVALHRFMNRVAALTSRKVGRFDREGGYAAVGALSMTQWLRHQCHLAGRQAGDEVRTARRLEELPVARQSFEQGDFSVTHASILARTVDEVGNQPNPDYSGQPGEARNVEETLVESALKLDPGELWMVCKHLKLCLDPDGSLRDWERQERAQYLEAARTFDGMLHLQGLLAPEGAAVVTAALDAAMGPRPKDDKRGVPERRAEALVDLAQKVLEGGELPSHDGERPHLDVLVDYSTLRGEPGNAAILDQNGQPVPGRTAERIACDCVLTPIVMGARGDVLRIGRKQRLFTPKQSLAMAIRDRHCAFPPCDRDLRWCGNHHLVHWLHGGATDVENGAKLCRRHHTMCHEGGWRLWRDEAGEYHADPP
jgi:Domain of unknown function (DUF222)